MKYRTNIKQARNLGSAKSGYHHWWMQRMSAVALVPLTIWFMLAAASHTHSDFVQVQIWVSEPVNAILLSLLVIISFYHAAIGLQVVIEDYVHCSMVKIASILSINFVAVLAVSLSLWSILRVAV